MYDDYDDYDDDDDKEEVQSTTIGDMSLAYFAGKYLITFLVLSSQIYLIFHSLFRIHSLCT